MLLVLSLPAAAGAQEPCTDPADACAEALLDAFQPHLFFEDDGPAGVRIDFPTDFVGADDDTVENNFEHLFGGPAYGVYRNAVRLETDEAPCWLLQYHFYFAANWHPDIWEADGYTHEHDWEWVYVLAGWSWRLGRYVGFAATLSQHDRDNLDAMTRLHTYLYPLIVLDLDQSQDWVHDMRRLTSWTGDREALLARAGLVFGARGNELRPLPADRQGLLEVGLPDWIATVPDLWQLGQQGTGCERDTDCENCYGDPHVCRLPFICSGVDECGDCGPERYPPWRRSGLWGSASVPPGFLFPQDLRTVVDPEPVAAGPLEVRLDQHCCHLHWSWQGACLPAVAELAALAPDFGWRCNLGRIELDRCAGSCDVVILNQPLNTVWSAGAAPVGAGWAAMGGGQGTETTLYAPCLWSPQRRGAWLEIWLEDSCRTPRLIARSRHPLPGVTAQAPAVLQLRSSPRPALGRVRFEFQLPHASRARLVLADLSGRRLAARDLGTLPAGAQAVSWDLGRAQGGSATSGVFWLRLQACGLHEQIRICCLR